MTLELENFNSIIEQLVKRIKHCEEVACQYKLMFDQLESKLKVLTDREGNIQQVYDYMIRIGSQITVKNPDRTAYLSPLTNLLPKDDKKYKKILEVIKKAKFKVGEKVFYANESDDSVTLMIEIIAIDVIDKHPRYCLEGILGYIDECKLFKTYEEARRQLDEWKSLRGNPCY
jgi:hypothetical protein